MRGFFKFQPIVFKHYLLSTRGESIVTYVRDGILCNKLLLPDCDYTERYNCLNLTTMGYYCEHCALSIVFLARILKSSLMKQIKYEIKN